MPYTPIAFATLAELQQATADRIRQNNTNAIDEDVHQQSELDQAASLWRDPTAASPLVMTGPLTAKEIALEEGIGGVTLQLDSVSGTYCAVGAGSGTVISFGAYSTLIQDPALVFSGTLNVGAYVQ